MTSPAASYDDDDYDLGMPAAPATAPAPLSAVPDTSGTQPQKAIPDFEGLSVHGTVLSLNSARGVDVLDEVFRVDEVIKMVIEVRITKVNHETNEKTPDLTRVHVGKIVDASVVPYDYQP